MGLTDLVSEIRQDVNSFHGDEALETKVLNQVLKLVEDKISEVKNQAVKWYARPTLWYYHARLNVLASEFSSRSYVKPRWNILFRSSFNFLVARRASFGISQV
jgi:hypothetical protein